MYSILYKKINIIFDKNLENFINFLIFSFELAKK